MSVPSLVRSVGALHLDGRWPQLHSSDSVSGWRAGDCAIVPGAELKLMRAARSKTPILVPVRKLLIRRDRERAVLASIKQMFCERRFELDWGYECYGD